MNIMEIKNLSFAYKKNRPILKNVSFSIKEQDIFCLLGPNGSGKSTLLSQILFPDKEAKKHLLLYGKPYSDYSLTEKAKIISFVPQSIPSLRISVLQTVIMGRTPYQKSIFLKPSTEDVQIASDILEQLGMSDFADRELNTLSGGEVQRVFIAQALAKDAKIYFFDEPMSALDPEYQTNFLKIIQELSKKGAAIVFTSHNPNHLFSIKNANVGILNKEHNFTEISEITEEAVRKVEKVFADSLHIRYSKEHGEFVATFNS